MKSRKPFLLRLDPALYSALEGWAEQEMRSVNGQIEFLLKQAVLARDRKALPPDPPAAPPDVADLDVGRSS
jgi:hypothetical protein